MTLYKTIKVGAHRRVALERVEAKFLGCGEDKRVLWYGCDCGIDFHGFSLGAGGDAQHAVQHLLLFLFTMGMGHVLLESILGLVRFHAPLVRL